MRDRASYVVRQNKLTFVFTTPLHTNSEIAAHIHKHGDGVKVSGFAVDDAADAWHQTTIRGGESYYRANYIA